MIFSALAACSTSPGNDSGPSTGGRVDSSGGSLATGGTAATTGGVSTGGAVGSGGLTTGGAATGGAIANGGASTAGAGASNQAGAPAQGGAAGSANTGGASSGGSSNTGGASAQGGASAKGGASSGGAPAQGGNGKGGAAQTGGSTSTGGASSGGAAAQGGGGKGGASQTGGSTGTAGTTGTSDPNNGANGSTTPIGFAGVAGMGLNTTTGGSGGTVVTVTTFEQLSENLDSDATLIILVQGSIDLQGGMVPMRSNKSLIGLAGARLHNGGLEMNKRQNIIVRNIIFADGTDDTFKINQNTHHVWVDHCEFTNAADGLFDITRQSSYITISWNHFYQHSKTMLIGHSDSQTDDTGYLKTTVHHNFFDGTEQRHPRVRFGEVHVFNNFFLSNMLYGVASTMEAKVVVEGNYFQGVPFPTHSGYQESGPGDLVQRNNVFDNSGTPEVRGTAFDPTAAYKYVVENPTLLPALIRDKAGVGVIDPMAAAK